MAKRKCRNFHIVDIAVTGNGPTRLVCGFARSIDAAEPRTVRLASIPITAAPSGLSIAQDILGVCLGRRAVRFKSRETVRITGNIARGRFRRNGARTRSIRIRRALRIARRTGICRIIARIGRIIAGTRCTDNARTPIHGIGTGSRLRSIARISRRGTFHNQFARKRVVHGICLAEREQSRLHAGLINGTITQRDCTVYISIYTEILPIHSPDNIVCTADKKFHLIFNEHMGRNRNHGTLANKITGIALLSTIRRRFRFVGTSQDQSYRGQGCRHPETKHPHKNS